MLAKGTVEAVNAERGVFVVRCDAAVKPFPRELKVDSADDQAIHVLSGIMGLPREVAFGLVSP